VGELGLVGELTSDGPGAATGGPPGLVWAATAAVDTTTGGQSPGVTASILALQWAHTQNRSPARKSYTQGFGLGLPFESSHLYKPSSRVPDTFAHLYCTGQGIRPAAGGAFHRLGLPVPVLGSPR